YSGSKQSIQCRIAVGNVEAGDFVVTFILEARESSEGRIKRRRGIATLSHHANGLYACAVVCIQVDDICGIQRNTLSVESISSIFDEHDLVLADEGAVVESTMCDITEIGQRQSVRVQVQSQHATESPVLGSSFG